MRLRSKRRSRGWRWSLGSSPTAARRRNGCAGSHARPSGRCPSEQEEIRHLLQEVTPEGMAQRMWSAMQASRLARDGTVALANSRKHRRCGWQRRFARGVASRPARGRQVLCEGPGSFQRGASGEEPPIFRDFAISSQSTEYGCFGGLFRFRTGLAFVPMSGRRTIRTNVTWT
jgi:hypothetical protein